MPDDATPTEQPEPRDPVQAAVAADTLDFATNADPNQVVGPQPKTTPAPPAPPKPYDPAPDREAARGDLARGLLWLLGFTVAGVLVFVALGRIDGTAVTQSIFPSLIALAGTALGFYFGTEAGGGKDSAKPSGQ
jgi:hypothetical protein